MIAEEKLIAYVDGEASQSERAEIEAAAAADPELAGRIDAHRRLRAKLARAYAPIAEEPAPSSLVDLAMGARKDNVVRFASKPERRFLPVQIAALAASLIVGVFLGMSATREAGLVVADAQGLRAAGTLSRALDEELASEGEPADTLRVVLTFRNREGRYCRVFEAPRLAGVACKQGRDWRIAVAEAAPSQRNEYRMAASSAALAVMDATIVGEPLDDAQERTARAQRWRGQ